MPRVDGRVGRQPRVVHAVLVLAAVAGALALFLRATPEPTGPVTVAVDARHPGRVIPRSFLGFSIEYPSVMPYFGRPGRPNGAVLGLLRSLGDAQRSPLGLRVGGNSGDESWWNPGGRLAKPPGILTDLGPGFARSLAQGQAALGAPLAMGLDLAHGNVAGGLSLVRAVRAAGLAAPGITTLEIGNEPDLYASGRTFTVGRLRVVRPQQRAAYDPAAYGREASAFAARLEAGLAADPGPAPRPAPTRAPGAPILAAGGFATPNWVRAAVPPLLAADPGRFGELTAHTYGVGTCNGADGPAAQRDALLSDGASRGLAGRLIPYQATGLPVRVGELNTVVCGGVAGVSDTQAAALWAPDALFALANAGAIGADVHTWAGALYAPWVLRGRTVTARPLYLGLLLFARAAPAGSRLVPVRLTDAGNGVRAWATQDGPVQRLLVINRSGTHAREIRRPGSAPAQLELLRAPGPAATAGVTLDGQQIPAGSRDGALTGPRRRIPLAAGASFVLPPASAALLTSPA